MTQTTPEQRQGDIIDTECRLRAWIRDFGHEKQPAFIRDLTDVLDSLSRLRTALAEAERDAARLTLYFMKRDTESLALVDLEMRLLKREPVTMDEVRTAIDEALGEPEDSQ